MNIDTSFSKYITGKVCPYCDNATEYVDSIIVYRKSYGMIYLCKPCDAYVGTHKNSNRALGRLADEDLRNWKKQAHAHFDPLWVRKMRKGFSKKDARSLAYKWLSAEMGLPPEYTHIGMFDIEQCKKVIEICKPYIK
jgi:hypothetical protein